MIGIPCRDTSGVPALITGDANKWLNQYEPWRDASVTPLTVPSTANETERVYPLAILLLLVLPSYLSLSILRIDLLYQSTLRTTTLNGEAQLPFNTVTNGHGSLTCLPVNDGTSLGGRSSIPDPTLKAGR